MLNDDNALSLYIVVFKCVSHNVIKISFGQLSLLRLVHQDCEGSVCRVICIQILTLSFYLWGQVSQTLSSISPLVEQK